MRIFWIRHLANGQITASGVSNTQGGYDGMFLEPGEEKKPTESLLDDPTAFYWDELTGQPVDKGQAPGDWAVFDYSLRQWVAKTSVEDIGVARARASYDINRKAGDVRRSWVTNTPAQQMIYVEKAKEARTYLSLPVVPALLTDFPLMSAEIGITAPDAYQLAQIWANMETLWLQAAADIERERISALTLVREEASVQTILEIATAACIALETLTNS